MPNSKIIMDRKKDLGNDELVVFDDNLFYQTYIFFDKIYKKELILIKHIDIMFIPRLGHFFKDDYCQSNSDESKYILDSLKKINSNVNRKIFSDIKYCLSNLINVVTTKNCFI